METIRHVRYGWCLPSVRCFGLKLDNYILVVRDKNKAKGYRCMKCWEKALGIMIKGKM